MRVDSLEVVIQSDASRANAELDKMIAKLQQVSGAITNTSSKRLMGGGGKGMSSGLSSFITTSGRARKSTMSLASAFGKFYANCFLFIRGVKALGKSITSTMDYIETYNYYNVIMDKIGAEFGSAWKENGYDSAEAYAKSFKERLNELTGKMTGYKIGEEGGLYSTDSIGLGLDPERMLNYQASIASITNAVGLCGETSIDTAKAMSMLAADMSSLKNVDLDTVMTNLQSGLIGQSRALYKYGIDITNATLQTYAYKYGVEKAVSEMTQAEKMQLRMLAILDQSKVAWGDMANTINGVANQYRILKQQVSNLARTIGAIFIPVLQAVLPYINGFVIALRRLFEWLGTALYGADAWSKLMNGISSGYTDSGLDALNGEADDVTDSLKDADKAANKLKKTIHGYDELHVATDNSAQSTSIGGTGGIDLSDEIASALADYESIWNKALEGMENKASQIADKIIAYFKKIRDAWNKDADMSFIGEDVGNWVNKILTSIDWDKIKEIGYKLGKSISTALSGFLRTTDWKEVGEAIAESWNTVVQFWKGIIENFDYVALGEAIGNVVNGFFDNFSFTDSAQTLNTFVDGLETVISKAIETIEWKDVFKGIKDFFEEIDIDTAVFLIGAFSFKYMGKLLTSSVIKDLLMKQIFGGKGSAGSSQNLGVINNAVFNIGIIGLAKQTYDQAKINDELTDSYNRLIELSKKGIKAPNMDDFKTYADYLKSVDEFNTKYGNGDKLINPESEFNFNWGKNWNKFTKVDLTNDYEEPKISEVYDKLVEKIKKWQEESRKTRESEKAEFNTWCDDIGIKFNSWYENDVAPWFTVEKWSLLWENVKSSFSTKWDEISEWWKSSTLVTWWNESVAPWFTAEKWTELYNTIKESLVSKWDEISEWWKSSTLVTWWNESVAPWFTAEKWTELYNTIKESLVSKWDETVGSWKEKIGSWWNDDVKPWFTLDKWKTVLKEVPNAFETTFKSAYEKVSSKMRDMYDDVSGFIGKIIDKIQSALDKLSSLKSKASSSEGSMSSSAFRGISFSIPTIKIPKFATGGFPEDGMFMANHNELVGKFNNGKTAVANNEQITDGIRSAVVDGMMSVLMTTNSNDNNSSEKETHIHVHFGSEELGVATYRGLKDAGFCGLIPKLV